MTIFPELFDADELADLPGAPFTPTTITRLSALIRSYCGWHIAPVINDETTLDANGGTVLMLPSLRVAEVDEVIDLTLDEPAAIEDYRLSSRGMLSREQCWPTGYGSVQVSYRHGYTSCPAELTSAAADIAAGLSAIERSRVSSMSVGGIAVTYAANGPAMSVYAQSILDRYRV